MHRVADKLLSKIEKAVDALEDEALETQQYRQLTASLKDLKDIQMIKSEADIREQEARIATLKKQASKDDEGANEIRVVFENGGDKEWAE